MTLRHIKLRKCKLTSSDNRSAVALGRGLKTGREALQKVVRKLSGWSLPVILFVMMVSQVPNISESTKLYFTCSLSYVVYTPGKLLQMKKKVTILLHTKTSSFHPPELCLRPPTDPVPVSLHLCPSLALLFSCCLSCPPTPCLHPHVTGLVYFLASLCLASASWHIFFSL